ncbi:MAG: hypothetical protein ACYDAN_05335 [Candidatus Limnocylindrales bacterium]
MVKPDLAVVSQRLSLFDGRPFEASPPQPGRQHWYRWAFAIHEDATDWGPLPETDRETWVDAEADLAAGLASLLGLTTEVGHATAATISPFSTTAKRRADPRGRPA